MEPVWKNSTLSLKEKFSLHYQTRNKKVGTPHVKMFNFWAPVFFFFTYFGASAWGVFVIVPAHYQDYNTFVVAEVFTVYVFFQILINWLLLKFTNSTYDPAVHGSARPGTYPTEQPGLEHDILEERTEMNGSNWDNGGADVSLNDAPPSSSKTHDGSTYQVFVAISVSEEKIERKRYAYWSWLPCLVCQRPRPPRCHHCTLCQRCVLKRDHHCFFARNCVGLNNQRYFIYFLFWCIVMTTWGSYQLTYYVFNEILPLYSYWDFVFPISLFRAVFGYIPLPFFHLTFVNLGTIALLVLSSGMFVTNVYFLVVGLTSFESSENIKIVDTRNLAGRLRAVLGENWGLSVIVPGYAYSGPVEDAVYWPEIKAS